jgi:gliding motility-associated-like protein
MRCWLLIFVSLSFVALSFGQKRDKPKIEGQRPVSTDEDQSVTINLNDLTVRDRDDWFYPFGFTLTVHPGENYTINTTTITPAANFNGKLKVKVTVNDGEHDSGPYDMEVTVNPINDPPVITGQVPLATNQREAITVKPTDLTISDPEDKVLTFSFSAGANYTVEGMTITPDPNFSGQLTIPVTANDGKINSAPFNLMINVIPVNFAPRITGQAPLATDEGTSIVIQLSNLTVVDPDNSYPTGFTLNIAPPANNTYTVTANTIQPAANFEGELSVPLRVNDGKNFSEFYNLKITVRPGNNAPVITGQSPVSIKEDEVFTMLHSYLFVSDADNVYPNDFSLKISNGTNYTVSNNQITPAKNFTGKLIVGVMVNDGTNNSAPFNFEITVGSTNDSPIVTLEVEALIFQPGKGAVFITETIQIKDAENDSLTQAEVAFFPQFYAPGYDELKFVGSDLIKSSFDLPRGVLLFTGKAPISEYLKAIKAVQYNFLAGAEAFTEGKKFSVKVSDSFSTSDPTSRGIRTKALDVELDIPSGFTPNGDAANDTWSIKPLRVSEELNGAVVRVYHRNGTLLFETIGFEKEWDGRLNGELLPCDSYFYTIDLGENYVKASIKGVVTILR